MPLKLVYKNHTLIVRFFILLVAFAIAFASNLYLPSLPALGKHFHTSDEDMELTITFFLLGYGSAQLIYGPLSDWLGRRKVLFLGFLIAFIGSVGCLKAHTVWQFVIARFILGGGISAGAALARSILRDTFSGITLTKVVLQNGLITSIAPLAAPMLGAYIEKWFGYQFNLLIIMILMAIILLIIWMLLIETNQNLDPNAFYPQHIIKNYLTILKNKIFLGNVICAGLCFSGMTVFLTVSPFLFQENLGLSILEYGWITSIVVSGMIIGRIINSMLMVWFKPSIIMQMGMIIMLCAGVMMLIPSLFHIMNVTVIIIPALLFIIGTAFIMTLAYAQSLEPFTKFLGSAGALYGSIMTLIAFISSGIVAIIPSNTQILLAVTYICLTVGTIFAFQLLKE